MVQRTINNKIYLRKWMRQRLNGILNPWTFPQSALIFVDETGYAFVAKACWQLFQLSKSAEQWTLSDMCCNTVLYLFIPQCFDRQCLDFVCVWWRFGNHSELCARKRPTSRTLEAWQSSENLKRFSNVWSGEWFVRYSVPRIQASRHCLRGTIHPQITGISQFLQIPYVYWTYVKEMFLADLISL